MRAVEKIIHQLSMNKNYKQLSQTLPFFQFIIVRAQIKAQYYSSPNILNNLTLDFVADFHGFFQKDLSSIDQAYFYFEGMIQNMQIVEIDERMDVQRMQLIENYMVVGYLRGQFLKVRYDMRNRTVQTLKTYDNLQDLPRELRLSVLKECTIIVPTFTRINIKKISSIILEKSIAEVEAVLIMEMKISTTIFQQLTKHQDIKFILTLNRDNAVELPVSDSGDLNLQNGDLSWKYKQSQQLLKYTLRKTFKARIDGTYMQFFSPFNLTHLRIVAHLEDITTQLYSNPTTTCKFTFLNQDLDDKIEDRIYSPFNDIFDEKSPKKAHNRVSKINFVGNIQIQEYYVCLNYFYSFPYYKDALLNSNKKNVSLGWSFGLIERESKVVHPQVLSIQEGFEDKREKSGNVREKHLVKLFSLSKWNYTHIQIPIYKYWTISFIQIFLPLLILSAISIIIFFQETGRKADGTNVLGATIQNVSSLMFAYVALIPLIRQNIPILIYTSFLYVAIYLSLIPLFLLLIPKVLQLSTQNVDYLKKFRPFQDIYFISSFCLFIVIQIFIFTVLAVSIYHHSRIFQVKKRFRTTNFASFQESQMPKSYKAYMQQLSEKRPEEYRQFQILHRQ